MNDSLKDAELKPVYAVSRLHFGAFRDAQATKDKYWYFGALRSHASYMLGSFNRNKPVKVSIKYAPPCSGCSKCYLNRSDLTKRREEVKNKRWWHPFIPSFRRNLSKVKLHYPVQQVKERVKLKYSLVSRYFR